MTSDATSRAQALVAERLPEARGLGQALADLIDDPEAFVEALREGLDRLADSAYATEQARVAPSPTPIFGVRNPLVAAVQGQLRTALKSASPSTAVWLAQRLAAEPEREIQAFAHACLRRALLSDPERSWQLMRQLARAAQDWISVDSLAYVYGEGILNEPYRWAELEQLVYSADRWERRLVGSTVASIGHLLPRHRRAELARSPGLMLIKSLLGDGEPDVQKSLSWALRSWWEIDPFGVREFIRQESMRAKSENDGHRAWVLRDALTLPQIDSGFTAEIRERLAGVRRTPGAPSTSAASEITRQFTGVEKLADAALAQQGSRY